MPKLLHLIVACAENRVIGRNGKLPWRIPEDLEHFHAETAGRICVLGRVCYDTWPRVHADGRRPIVLTSRPLPPARDESSAVSEIVASPAEPKHRAIAVRSLPEALATADALPGEIYVCGGQRIFEECFALAAAGLRRIRIHMTLVHAEVPGDTFFPKWRHRPWKEISRRESADANYRYTFLILDQVADTDDAPLPSAP